MSVEWIEPPAEYDGAKSLAENRQRPRGTVRCDCGAGVDLSPAARGPSYAAACSACGQWFNLSGQRLRPPHEWAEAEEG